MSFWSDAWDWISGSSASANLAKTALLGYGVKLISDSINEDAKKDAGAATVDQGVRLQLSPDTENKIPVLYGTAFFAGDITDANLSADYKTMTYCLTLAEATGTRLSGGNSAYTFKNVYLNNNRVVFKADGVTVDYTLDRAGNQDVSYRDLVKIYFYAAGQGIQPEGKSGTTPASSTVMPGWTAGTHPMTGLIYAIVKVTYNRDKGVTGLPTCVFEVSNSMTLPGDVLYDYMTSSRYGANIAISEILTSSLTELNTFCSTGFSYTNAQGQTVNSAITINGVIDTNGSVLDTMEEITKAAGSWLSYDIYLGKWRVIINRAGSSIASLNDSNLIGEISISGTSLTQLNNIADVKYLNNDIQDKPDYVKITLPEASLYANEPRTSMQINLPYTNKQAVALKIGAQLLKQARIDKIIKFTTDYSYINLTAGDLIDITSPVYAFTNKVFRIITAEEIQGDDGELQVEFTALEYSADVYTFSVTEFQVETNDGIIQIGSIGKPGTPQVTKVELDSRPRITATSTSPSGVVEGMEFWLTNDTTVPDDINRTYRLIGTRRPVNGGLYPEGTAVTLEYDGLSSSDFYVKTRGFNAQVFGPYSDPSGLVEYRPKQATDAISNNTQVVDNLGQLATVLAVLDLLKGVDGLFSKDSSVGGLFDTIFDIFKTETGTDILGDAKAGTLVVASNVIAQEEGTDLTTSLAKLNFVGSGVTATASGNDITVTIPGGTGLQYEGTPKKDDTVAYDGSKWVLVPSCCNPTYPGPVVPPEPPGPCIVDVTLKYPPDRETYACPLTGLTSDQAPISGSYYLVFGNRSFYGALTTGTGNAKLYKSDGTLVETLSASQLVIDKNVVGFPFANREAGTDYYILLDQGVVKYCDCVNAAITTPTGWNFNTPFYLATPYNITGSALATPELKAISASPSGQDICPITDLIITFNHSVEKGTGNAYIKKASDGSTVATLPVSAATITGASVNFGSIADKVALNETYQITADAGVVKANIDCNVVNLNSLAVSGYTFKTTTALVLTSFDLSCGGIASPVNNANPQSNVKLIFNRAIAFGTAGFVRIYDSAGALHQEIDIKTTFEANKTSELLWISGDTLYINPTKDFEMSKTYYVQVTPLAIKDSCGLTWNGISDTTTARFTITSGPQATSTPVDQNSTKVELTYSEPIQAGPGTATVVNTTTGQTVKTVGSTDSGVSYQ